MAPPQSAGTVAAKPWAAGLPALAGLHSVSLAPGDLVRNGSQYDQDSAQRVSVAAPDAAQFNPDYTGAMAHQEPAWAVYQFSLAGFSGGTTLQLSFGQAANMDDVWLACADWQAGHWTFRRPGPGGDTVFTASQFSRLLEQGSGRLACAVIILGQQDWQLDKLQLTGNTGYLNADCPLGVNLEGMADWSTSRVWVDAFKTAREWFSQPSDGSVWDDGRAIPLDANGWPASLTVDQFATTVLITEQGANYPTGDYICLYDGEGVIEFHQNAYNVSQTPGRIVVHVAPTSSGLTYMQIRQTNPANNVRNIRLLLPGYETTYASQVFTPEFLASCAPFKVLRFMDWTNANGTSVTDWNSRATPEYFSQATARGVAVEHMVDLCNRLQADPWFSIGHLMDDDAVRQFAIYVRDNLDPSLRIYVEHSNEVWNSQFPQAQYAQQRGLDLGLSKDPTLAKLYYHAKRSVEIFAIWEDVFGGADRLVRVLGAQAVNTWATEQLLCYEDTPAHTDALAIAPYFGFTVSESQAAGVKAAGIPGIVSQWQDIIATQRADYLDAQQALCTQYGLQLIAYEGGQHLVGVGNAVNDDELTALLTSANRTPELRQLYVDYLNNWRTASNGGIMLAFSHIGRYSKWGSWGLRETQSQDPSTAPKWQGCLDFLAQF